MKAIRRDLTYLPFIWPLWFWLPHFFFIFLTLEILNIAYEYALIQWIWLISTSFTLNQCRVSLCKLNSWQSNAKPTLLCYRVFRNIKIFTKLGKNSLQIWDIRRTQFVLKFSIYLHIMMCNSVGWCLIFHHLLVYIDMSIVLEKVSFWRSFCCFEARTQYIKTFTF